MKEKIINIIKDWGKGWIFLIIWTAVNFGIYYLFKLLPLPQLIKLILEVIWIIFLGYFSTLLVKFVYKIRKSIKDEVN